MNKKILIGLAVIGASVAVLGGCGGSESKGSNNSKTIAEMNENKRTTFESYTPSYQIYAEDGYITCELPDEWYPDDSDAISGSIATWVKADISNDATIRVQYNFKKLGDGSIKAQKQDFEDYVKLNELTTYEMADTTVKGFEALYEEAKTNDRTNGSFVYAVPLSDGTLYISLSCPYDMRESYIDNLDKVASSIDIPSYMKP